MPITNNEQNVKEMLIEMQDALNAGHITPAQSKTCNPVHFPLLEDLEKNFLQYLSDNKNWMRLASAIDRCVSRGGNIKITIDVT